MPSGAGLGTSYGGFADRLTISRSFVPDLTDELPDEEGSSIATGAEMLTAIAAAEGVPIGVLISVDTHARSRRDMERRRVA